MKDISRGLHIKKMFASIKKTWSKKKILKNFCIKNEEEYHKTEKYSKSSMFIASFLILNFFLIWSSLGYFLINETLRKFAIIDSLCIINNAPV